MSVTDQPTTVNVDCAHREADHVHGTHACYVLDQCRCDECRRANAAYEKSRAVWLAGVRPHPLVDAEPARKIVDRLTDVGIGLKTISKNSGVSHGTIWKLMYGKNGHPSKRVRRETLDKIEKYAKVAEPADGAKVPAVEAWLIVDELVARGWTKAAIGRRVHGPDAVSLQLSRREVTYGHVKTLRGLLTDPVPPRRSRHGTHEVTTDHEWRSWRELTNPLRDKPVEVVDLTARRQLLCKVCDRPLVDHGLMERCA